MTYQQELPWKGTVAGRTRPTRRARQTQPGVTGAGDTRATRPVTESAGSGRSLPVGDWRIDETTRRAGRRGLAEARAALARVRDAAHEGTAA
jgi:hypothetical protein